MASSEEIGLQRLDNGLNSHSQLVFHDDTLPRFNCAAAAATSPHRRAGDPGPKTRELSAFIDDKIFPPVDRDRYFPSQAEFRRSIFAPVPHRRDHPLTDGSDDDDDDDDEDEDEDEDDDEGDGEVEALVAVDDHNHNKSHNTGSSGSTKAKLRCSLGSNREAMAKDSSFVQTANNARANPSENNSHQQGRVVHLQNAVTVAVTDGDVYYSQFLQGPEGSGSAHGQKETGVENGCGFSGRKEGAFSSESGDSLRAILSDPITGALMDDAVILPCGHSFGSSGLQQVIRMKACFTCSQSVSEDSVAPNLSLRAAVLAFRREEESQFYRVSKRRRERFEQDKGNYCDSYIDPPRGRGVQFPFAVTDRVIIKGNKRTPQRFVGREAVVTTQCLNGWYVVKTLDNAESVKLQYRSLAKVSDNSSSKSLSSKAPNWL